MKQDFAPHEKTRGARPNASGKGKKIAWAKIKPAVQGAAASAAREATRERFARRMISPELRGQLEAIARVIAQQLARKPEHFIIHPTEMKLFCRLSVEELRDFASAHGWRVVRRVGGRRVEFYNDAHERDERARTGNARSRDETPAL